MLLIPVFPLYEQGEDDLIRDFNSIAHILCSGGAVVADDQDYLEWPLVLSSEERLALDDDQYETYTDITDYFLSEMEEADIPSEGLTAILIRNY